MAFGKKPEPIPVKKKLPLPKISYEGPFKNSIEIAQFYGFRLIEPLPTTKKDREVFTSKKKKKEVPEKYLEFDLAPEERARIMHFYISEEMPKYAQPVLLVHIDRNVRKKEGFLKLEIIGSGKAVAEAVVLHVAHTILKERGVKEMCIQTNSLGDEDAEEEFEQELIDYLREHINLLDPKCRQAFSTSPYEIFESKCSSSDCMHVKENAPRSVGFLSEHDRHHLMEVLEYLEVLDIPYEVKQGLFGSGFYHVKDLYEIQDSNKSTPLAKGEKFESLSKLVGLSKLVPTVTISIRYEKVSKKEVYKKASKQKDKRPLFYFIQLGFDAKRKSLSILEMLRKANIRVRHNIFKDDMQSQKTAAVECRAPYIIIIGQKEANEGTAIVRDVESRSQETVPVDELAGYVKKLK